MSDQRPVETIPKKGGERFLIAYRAGPGPYVTEAIWSRERRGWDTRYAFIEEGSPDLLGWMPMPEWKEGA